MIQIIEPGQIKEDASLHFLYYYFFFSICSSLHPSFGDFVCSFTGYYARQASTFSGYVLRKGTTMEAPSWAQLITFEPFSNVLKVATVPASLTPNVQTAHLSNITAQTLG